MKICIVVGTRPEIIKLSSLILDCKKNNIDYFMIHSNQHYSEDMDKFFFDDFKLPQPKYNLKAKTGSQGLQTADILIKIEEILLREKPDIMFVQGDTNTVLAAALAGTKLNCKIAHVEAGLRSYDRSMPEETNRVLTDHVSDYLFTPTKKQKEILLNEGIDESRIFVVGNTIVDAVYRSMDIAEKNSKILEVIDAPSEYILLTAHRPANVDDKKNLKKIIDIANDISSRTGYEVVFPMHPRTLANLKNNSLVFSKGVKVIDPVGYFDFIKLQKNAKFIVTDSGGIQEEACIMKVPCITIRENTERPETIDVGANYLTGLDKEKVLQTIKIFNDYKSYNWENPFGDGTTSRKILEITLKS